MKLHEILFISTIILSGLFIFKVQGIFRCEPNWILYKNRCFRLFRDGSEWYLARRYCWKEGGHLAWIKNLETQKFLEKNIFKSARDQNIWIGLSDYRDEGKFLWHTEDNYYPSGKWKYWGPGQPNDYNDQDCVHIWNDHPYKWADSDCGEPYPFLCEKPGIDTCKPPTKNNNNHGVIRTYNYPSTLYDNNEFCRWKISVAKGYVIKLVFSKPFDLEDCCACDNVKVFEIQPGATKSKLKATFCKHVDHQFSFTSSTSEIVVEFRTDRDINANGFLATWSKVVPTCGGTFPATASSGILFSNNYPFPYGRNEFCKWTINAEEGYLIKIIFTPPFDVKSNAGCHDGSVKIFDVSPSGTRTLKGTWCGTQPPPDFITSTSKVEVEFASTALDVGRGFSATWIKYEKPCSGRLEGKSGEIMSPNYPSTYPRHLRCRWEIDVNIDQFIELEFTSFNLSGKDDNLCAFDKIEIFDVFGNGSWIKRGQWCESGPQHVIKSFGHKMLVQFNTDDVDDNNGLGFSAKWRAEPSCGDVYQTDHGSLSFPTVNSYRKDTNCRWEIHVHSWFKGIKLQFGGRFDIGHDQIEVFGVSSNSSVQQLKAITSLSPQTLLLPFSSLILTFKSTTAQPGKGFDMSWDPVCKQVLDGSKGKFTSPQYGKEYPSNLDCEWEVKGAKYQRVHLKFSTFDLEFTKDCMYDYVEVFDSMPNGTLVTKGRFCGDTPPPPVMSLHSSMVVRFHSDGGKSGKGFMATWDTACGDVYQQNHGQIETPNYPIGFPDYSYHCQWEIQADKYHLIRLTFNQTFSLAADERCNTNYVEIFDYSHNGSLISKGRWCGHVVPPPQISTSSRMLVVFHSDKRNNNHGFQAVWDSVCGEVFESTKGIFSSPNFGLGHYPPDLDCEWKIKSQDGHPVNLYFQSPFELESSTSDHCKYDYLEVFDSFHDGTLISKGRFCGNKPPSPLVSSSSTLVVRFHSDHDKSGNGFNASWNTSCHKVFTSPDGFVTSPGYPQEYDDNMDCTWEINVDSDHRIKVQFSPVFDLESHVNCDYDSVEILDYFSNGTDVSHGRYCGNRKPPTFISSSSRLAIHFHSDMDKNGNGFNASWETVETCGNTFYEGNGFLMSPNYPSGYPSNLNCTWEIIPPGGSTVTLSFDALFSLDSVKDCDQDYVEIYRGNTKLGRWCGSTSPPPVVSHEKVVILFKSEKGNDGKGFYASWIST